MLVLNRMMTSTLNVAAVARRQICDKSNNDFHVITVYTEGLNGIKWEIR